MSIDDVVKTLTIIFCTLIISFAIRSLAPQSTQDPIAQRLQVFENFYFSAEKKEQMERRDELIALIVSGGTTEYEITESPVEAKRPELKAETKTEETEEEEKIQE